MRLGSIAAAVGALLVLATPARAADQVLYVGDSLGVGTTPGLARELAGSANVHGDSRIGRPSPEGLRVLQQTFSPSDEIVVFDLGTNDDPAQPGRLAADLAAARRATGDRCLVVATLNRPPLNGVPVDGLNSAVLAFAGAAKNVQLVDWNAIVSSEPGLLGPDHVHPTPQGYALRAQLFADAIGACGSKPAADEPSQAPAPAPKPKRKPRKPRRVVKVPGIGSSGISFTEPVKVRGLTGELLLPNTKPPYPAVVMLNGGSKAAEYLAAHGIATLMFPFRDSVADARAAVAALRARDDMRPDGVGLWGQGRGAATAAQAAAGDKHVAAVLAVSPAVIAPASARDWSIRRQLDGPAPAVTKWLRLRGDGDQGSTDAWRSVGQPVLAIWETRDNRMPVNAGAAALRDALAAGDNRDRTFRSFAAARGFAPGQLEESSRWLGLHLGPKRAAAVVRTPLPPSNGGPEPADVTQASALLSLPLQIAWLLAPAVLLGIAALRGGVRIVAIAVTGLGALVAIAFGVARALDSGGSAPAAVAGIPWPFALAFLLAGICLGLSARHAVQRDWLPAAAGGLWAALALFWLL